MNSNNKISVEVPLEHLVHEITYDGHEILETSLSMSEHLTKLAQRIDFTGNSDEGHAGEEDKEGDGEKKEATFKTAPPWPWESVRNKIRSSLTELSVLSDILTIAQQKKYLVLDPVQAESSDSKSAVTLYNKKKSVAAASSVLMAGAERLKNSLNEAKTKSSLASQEDFHIELLRLRQNWRLRKVGNCILGDLSYRTAGSRFQHPGTFEVSKMEDTAEKSDNSDDTTSGQGKNSVLKVTIPNELQGIAYIQVKIEEGQDTLSLAKVGLPPPAPLDAHWRQRLEAAQNVLFCKELFSVLAREAVLMVSMPIPPLVVGDQITATLFPGINLVIRLCHSISSKSSSSEPTPPKLDQDHILEHSLHQLLREVHRSNACLPIPHPASAPIGIPKKRRLAGPAGSNRNTLIQMTKKEVILEEIIQQSQHVVLRQRTMQVLDTLAVEIKDPLIIIHWASLNNVTHSTVRVTLQSSGYDMCSRTHMLIHVMVKSLKCILKDGRALHLSYEPQELRDVLLTQIAIHQIMVFQPLVKCMGFHVLASSTHLGIGPCETVGNAASCLVSSPNGKRILAIRSSPQKEDGITVHIGFSTPSNVEQIEEMLEKSSGSQDLEIESFEIRGGMNYKKISLDKLEGKNFLNKMEMLMAVLADAT